MEERYPSDITREQFEQIRPMLESIRQSTKPRKLDLYDVYCAVLYIKRSGCQWRMLPKEYPKWQSVYFYYNQWIKKAEGEEFTILERILKKNDKQN
jgi:transposase